MEKFVHLLLAFLLFGPVVSGIASGEMNIQNLEMPRHTATQQQADGNN